MRHGLRPAAPRGLFQIVSVYESDYGVAEPRWRLAAPMVSFEFGTILFAIGIAVYFAWPVEPVWWVAAVVAGCLALIAIVADSRWAGLGALLATGFAVAAFHTAADSPNPLEREQRLRVTGWVADVDTGGRMRRVTLRVAQAEPVPRTGLPKTVRFRVGRAWPDVRIGDAITADVVVGPLPGPAIPGGYDPARRAYFEGLAGSGFAIDEPLPANVELGWRDRATLSVTRFRRSVADRVMAAAPAQTAGLQAALLTGLRDDIPDAQTEALRASGLAHILAISGLHMGMVSFGLFALAGALLALLPAAAGRDMRKVAAGIAIVAATGYLVLSGASVATQRAYVMVCIAFLAVMLERRALSIRSVAVAAVGTLLLHPEALMSVGFQMSFAAVAALVVVFRWWTDNRPRRRSEGWQDRIANFYGSLAGTSLIAMVATGGFALIHFGRFANYGLLGNLAAMAIFPVVMGFGIASLALMPFGWEAAPLAVMGALLRPMLAVADWVAGLPGAVGHAKAPHPVALALYGLGFALACLATRKTLMLGAVLAAGALAVWLMTPRYDMRITEEGRVSVWTDGEATTSSVRADSYGRDMFSRALGEGDAEWTPYRDGFADCDALGCRFEHAGLTVSVVEEASEVAQSCADSDIVVLPERSATAVARRACNAMLLDGRSLRETGGVHIATQPRLRVQPIRSQRRARRPWGKSRE